MPDESGPVQAASVEPLARLARVARRALDAPFAVVWLADEPSRIVESAIGGSEGTEADGESGVMQAVCRRVADAPAPVAIPDLGEDAFERSAFRVVAVLGVPMRVPDGVLLGGFCVFDVRPRDWTAAQIELLQDLCRSAEEVLTLRNQVQAAGERPVDEADHHPKHAGGMEDAAHPEVEDYARAVVSSALCLLWQASVEDRDGRLHWSHRVPDERAAQHFLPLAMGSGETYVEAWKRSRLREDLPKMRATSEAACRAGLPRYTQEYRCRRADGVIRWLLEDVQVRQAAPGKWWAVGVCSDITERKLAELALNDSERRFRAMFEHSSDIVAVLDRDGAVVYQSPSILPILGYTPEEMVGQHAFAHVHPDDLDVVVALFQMNVEQASVPTVSIPYRVKTHDGSWRWFESVSTNLLDDPVIRGVVVNSRDITERLEMESVLREREREYRRIVETASEGIWMADADGCITYVNQQAARMLGYAPNEMLGRPVAEFVPEEDHPQLVERQARRKAGVTERYDARRKHKDGREVWVLVSATPLRDELGEHQGSLAMLTDITERKRAEDTLRASEARFRAIYDEAGIGIALVELSDRSLESNRALQRWLGYSREELATMLFSQFTHPEDLPLDRTEFEDLLAGKRDSYQVEKRFLRKDGRVVWGRLTVSAVHDAFRIPRLVVGMVEDVTERRRAESLNHAFQALGERLNSASTAKAAAQIVLEVADQLLGWDACWVELLDPERRQATGILSMDVIGGRRTEVVSQGRELLERPLTRTVLEKGATLLLREPDTLPAPDAPGHVFTGDLARPSASLIGVPIRNGSQVVGVLSIQSYSFQAYTQSDVDLLQALADYCAGAFERTQAEAARHELQQQLVHAQKMEAVGRLAGGVAHDFNNMLAVINGYGELLLQRPDLPSGVREQLDEVLRAGKRASTLTRQLLAYSRKEIIKPRVLELAEAVFSFHEMLRRLIGEDIELVFIPTAKGSYVEADPGQIEQVLLNLAVNARDAMPQGGRLTIRIENVELRPIRTTDGEDIPAGSYVCLNVSDTGCGIDTETLSHVFEPFYTTKPVGQGTGLGLATVYGIVRQARGYIEVESELGEGTTFRVYLPRVNVAPREADSEPEPARPSGRETILVVEDEEMVRQLVVTVLKSSGYQVLEAVNADEALRRCREHPGVIHLLLTDVVMPGRSGGELATFVSAQFPGMRVIFMSGYTDDAVVRHGVRSADVHFIQKPFTPSVLARTVRTVLDGG